MNTHSSGLFGASVPASFIVDRRRRLPKTKDAAAHAFDLTFKQSKDPNSGRFYGAEDLVIGVCHREVGQKLLHRD